MTAAEELELVAAEVAACTDCKLHLSRKSAVPGEGPTDAELLFIGEGPGFHENEQGRPFVGAAGNFLEELLASIGLSREEVFITNIVKCRPPGNRDPQAEEIEACSAYLERQTRSLNPKVVVTLGRFSMARFFPNARISAIHGNAQRIGDRIVVPMYHPAAALHQPSLRQTIHVDFARLPELIGREARPMRAEDPPDMEQLSLF
ncbi:MAG: uracil-DNA glycosylase family protein [Anaerolineales bacterium]